MAENLWLLDWQGTILQARRRQLDLAVGDPTGRRCAEVVRGRDPRGHELCARCPVIARLMRGAYTSETILLHDDRRLRCSGTATPAGIEVRLSTAPQPSSEEVLQSLARAVDRMHDRARWFQTLRCFLGVLRRATGVGAVELFLADPERTAMLLTLHHGKDLEAFQERAAFRIGEGYPGIVAYEGTPLSTHDLAADERYLRGAVKRLGYRYFISYPLLAPGGFVGVIDLASRRADVPVRELSGLLSLIAPVLGTALYSVLAELSERGLAEASAALRAGHAAAARARMVRLAAELAGARTVDLVGSTGAPPGGAPQPCGERQHCPVWRGEPHGVGVAGVACPMGAEGPSHYCLPWRLGEDVVGVQNVYLASPPSPATLYMAPILWLQHRAGQLLGALPDRGRAAAAPRVVIRAFGVFQVVLDGQPMDPRGLGRRKSWVLLKLLIAHRGRVLTREELAALLWPGDDPAAAIKRVHVLVSTLRKALERDPQAPALVLSEGDGYTFRPLETVDLDVETFERLTDEADRREGQEAIRGYTAALRLYRGEFMSEEIYNDWFELDRAYYRERVAAVLERCAALQQAQGHLGDAIVSLRRLLQLDPWHQPAYRQLARLLELRGDSEQALRVLQRGAALFAGEA